VLRIRTYRVFYQERGEILAQMEVHPKTTAGVSGLGKHGPQWGFDRCEGNSRVILSLKGAGLEVEALAIPRVGCTDGEAFL
jgi:hypothetical protein